MSKADNGKRCIDENNTLMANGRAKPQDKTSIATFIYNRQEGTFLGRNGKSWAQIIIFYIIFYCCLAAFWLACLAIFIETIDPKLPRYYGKNTIIGANPGVGYQPWLKDDPESTLIKFNKHDPASYNHYVEALDVYLDKYSNTNDTKICDGSVSNADSIEDGKMKEGAQACRFNLTEFVDNGCGHKDAYGFREGTPCIIVSLNRLIGWIPENYDSEVPKEIKSRYEKGSITFYCDGVADSDKELLGSVHYIPTSGISRRFYPYAHIDNYHQPIAMIKFTNLPTNRVVMVECRAYAKNIEQDPENRIGMVNFELMLQDNNGTLTNNKQ